MRLFPAIAAVTASVALSWGAFASAQENDAADEAERDDPGSRAAIESEGTTEIPEELFENPYYDEIEVVVGPQGQSLFELEMEQQNRMRENIYAEMRLREREEEEVAWRQADPDLQNSESRIKWGYSAQAEQRMRRSNDFMYDKPAGETLPATVFRVEF
ncbi:MAG: hypothetical protein ACR2QL_06500 [Woeseiaceae bacterium]